MIHMCMYLLTALTFCCIGLAVGEVQGFNKGLKMSGAPYLELVNDCKTKAKKDVSFTALIKKYRIYTDGHVCKDE